jgi:alpha,alpha-trehalose phosphorylase
MGLAVERARSWARAAPRSPWADDHRAGVLGVPAGRHAAFHIHADIADAVRRYLAATDDEQFEQGPALELLVATAPMWRSLGHPEASGAFRIDGVTGPGRVHRVVENNVYTNLMAYRAASAPTR